MSRNSTIIAGNNSNIISTGRNSNVFAYKNIIINSTPVGPTGPPFLCPDGSIPTLGPDGQYFCGGGGTAKNIFVNPIANSSFVEQGFEFNPLVNPFGFSQSLSIGGIDSEGNVIQGSNSIVIVYITDDTEGGTALTGTTGNYTVLGSYPNGGTNLPFSLLFSVQGTYAFYQQVPNFDGNNTVTVGITNDSIIPPTANIMIFNVLSDLANSPPNPELDAIQLVYSTVNDSPPFASTPQTNPGEFNLVFVDAVFSVPIDTPDDYNVVEFNPPLGDPEGILVIANPNTDLVIPHDFTMDEKAIELVQVYSAELNDPGTYPIERSFPVDNLAYVVASVTFT